MADRAELMRLGKEELAEGLNRLAARARRYKEKAKATAEQTMEFALASGTAFGVGYYMGTIKRDSVGLSAEEQADALKMFGVDRDLLIGVTLAGVGLTGMAGKRMSGASRAAGMGALSYWAGNYGEKLAMEAER